MKAHELLFEIYGDARDAGAAQILTGQMSEALVFWKRAGAEATHALLKARGSNFWSPEFQTILASRSMQKKDALLTRSKGGKKGGRTRNLNIAIKKEDRYLFFYDKKQYVCVFNCETGGDVCRILNAAVPSNLKRATPFFFPLC